MAQFSRGRFLLQKSKKLIITIACYRKDLLLLSRAASSLVVHRPFFLSSLQYSRYGLSYPPSLLFRIPPRRDWWRCPPAIRPCSASANFPRSSSPRSSLSAALSSFPWSPLRVPVVFIAMAAPGCSVDDLSHVLPIAALSSGFFYFFSCSSIFLSFRDAPVIFWLDGFSCSSAFFFNLSSRSRHGPQSAFPMWLMSAEYWPGLYSCFPPPLIRYH